MAWLTAGCVRRSLRAAREKLRSAATVDKDARDPRKSYEILPRQSVNKYSTTNLNIITLTFDLAARRRLRPCPTELIIFDTTLRDGEQAPGFSMRVDEKVRLARAARGAGRRHHRGRLPHRVGSRRRGRAARRAQAVERPVVAALARCAPGDIDRAAWAIAPARRGAHPHVHRDVRPAPRAQAPDDARGVPRRGRRRPSRARATYTDDVEFSAEDATRSDFDFLCRVVEARDRRGRDDDQSAGHGRLLDAGRDRANSSAP